MPEYVWKAKTTAGNYTDGEMNEVNESVVITKLKRMNYTDIKVKKKPKIFLRILNFSSRKSRPRTSSSSRDNSPP